MTTIKVNGKVQTIDKKINLLELIKSMGLSCDSVVTEHNSRIVPMEEREKVVLEEDDSLEIVSFVGGG
jgi:thiamine biosynthesis protein ThiS